MGSKREEERNEKIIRGLMKLPPNRRCINCNSLGPQYVCTNFWTFVCMSCSGIHREFTHRVKSVSMAKFTSQEVEALQNGGNQRAREIYLKDWDSQRQRLPYSSNVEKIREFIKSVYVDKRYAGGRTSEKPPRDVQSLRGHEDETRRASSYHSYSQSPPYDYQYEDRRYGKQSAVLTRKPGSDRGLYVGKMSSFVYSPGRSSEHMFEDRFANEGSVSRVSDYSASSGGDPFRSGAASPNFHKDIGFSSPPSWPSEVNCQRDADSIPRRQRTASSGSIGSFDSNSMSLRSQNSFVDVVSEPDQAAISNQDKMNVSPRSSAPINYGGLDLFQAPAAPQPDTSASSAIDFFQLSATSPVDTFQPSSLSPAPSMNLNQAPHTSSSSSIDLFAGIAPQPSTASLDNKSPELSNLKNEGWATFDTPPSSQSIPQPESLTPSIIPIDKGSSVKLKQSLSLNANMQWPPSQSTGAPVPVSSISNQWHDGLCSVQVPGVGTNTQSWNAFGDSTGDLTLESLGPSSLTQAAAHEPSSTADQNLGLNFVEDCSGNGIQSASFNNGPQGPSLSSYTPSGETQSYAADHKSTNPFDLPYDSDLEHSDVFLDMTSLQAALPTAHMPSSFLTGVAESWFPQNPVASYVPPAQGGLAYMAAQAPNSQLPNVQTQGPVASIGGNPFA